jgi:imidazolonepropionase-like amidohydrolase
VIRIEADRLIDGVGDRPHHPGCVEIEGDRVTGVDGRVGSSPDSLVLSLPGCSLLPGLWDFHSHLGLGSSLGTIEVGKVADVIAVEEDPVEDFTALSRVRLAVSRGRIVYLAQEGAPA